MLGHMVLFSSTYVSFLAVSEISLYSDKWDKAIDYNDKQSQIKPNSITCCLSLVYIVYTEPDINLYLCMGLWARVKYITQSRWTLKAVQK